MGTRLPALLALGALIVAGNTAYMAWLAGRGDGAPAFPRSGEPSGPPREIPARPRALPPGEAALPGPSGPRVLVVTEPGARIRVEAVRRAESSPFREPPLAEGTAGPDGTCGLVLARPVRARAVVEKEGYARASAGVGAPVAHVPLSPEGVIRGRVVEEGGGAPVAGAEVRCLEELALTAPDGSFVLRSLPAGSRTIRVTSADHPPAGAGVEVPSGGEAAVEVRMKRGFTLRGRAGFSGTDRRPAEGSISAGDRSAPLGPDGRFALQGLAGPVNLFRVETGGRAYRASGQRVAVDPATGEQVGEIEVALPPNSPPGLEFRGVVRDTAGRPVAGARVVAGYALLLLLPAADRGGGRGGLAEGWTDAEGRYRVVSDQGGNQVLVQHPDFGPTLFELPWRSRNREFNLTLPSGPSIRVTVRDAAGRPAEGAEVFACLRHPDPFRFLEYGDVHGTLRAWPLADAAGVAVLPRLGPGRWYLCARSPDGFQGARLSLEVEADGGDLAVDMALRVLPRISGRVVRRTGEPVAGFPIPIPTDESAGPSAAVVSGPDGRFRSPGLWLPPHVEAAGGFPLQPGGPGDPREAVRVRFFRETEIVLDRP